MIVVPFIKDHLKIEVHEDMGFIKPYLKDDDYANILLSGIAYTALVDDEVIACAGMISVGKNRWAAWALLSETSGKHMLRLTREIKKHFDEFPVPRLEIDVRYDFPAGHRWAVMLGFVNETPNGRPNWGDDGRNYCLYARIR